MSTDDLTDAPTPTLVARSPTDLLGVIPYLLGFHPRESLVVIALRGSGVVLTARVDLPTPAGARRRGARTTWARRLTVELSPVVERHGADGVVLVAYSADADAGRDAVARVAERFTVPVRAAVWAGPERWSTLTEDGAVEGGRHDPAGTAGAAEAVLAGLVALPDRDAVVAGVRPVAGPAAEVAARAADDLVLPDDPLDRERWLTGLLASGPIAPDPVDAAALALLVAEPRGFGAALDDLDRPADVHLRRWSAVARCVPLRLSGPPCALAGLSAWLTGDGALARSWLERGSAEHPTASGLALLDHVLDAAIAPTSWRPGH